MDEAVEAALLPEDEPAFEAAFNQARRTGRFHLEAQVLQQSDEIRWIVAEGRSTGTSSANLYAWPARSGT